MASALPFSTPPGRSNPFDPDEKWGQDYTPEPEPQPAVQPQRLGQNLRQAIKPGITGQGEISPEDAQKKLDDEFFGGAAKEEKPASWTDYPKAIGSGAAGLASSTLAIPEWAAGQMGATGAEQGIRQARLSIDGLKKQIDDSMSDEAKDELARQYLTMSDDKSIWKAKSTTRAILLQAAAGLPSMASLMLPGTLMVRAGMKAGAMVGMTAGNMLFSAGQVAENVADEISNAKESELLQSSLYQQLRSQMSEQDARNELIRQSQGNAPLIAAGIAGIVGAATGQFLRPRFLNDEIGNTLLQRLKGGAVVGGVDMGVQMGTIKATDNFAKQTYDEHVGIMDQVGEAATAGAVQGALAGGIHEGVAGKRKAIETVDPTKVPADQAAAAAALLSDKAEGPPIPTHLQEQQPMFGEEELRPLYRADEGMAPTTDVVGKGAKAERVQGYNQPVGSEAARAEAERNLPRDEWGNPIRPVDRFTGEPTMPEQPERRYGHETEPPDRAPKGGKPASDLRMQQTLDMEQRRLPAPEAVTPPPAAAPPPEPAPPQGQMFFGTPGLEGATYQRPDTAGPGRTTMPLSPRAEATLARLQKKVDAGKKLTKAEQETHRDLSTQASQAGLERQRQEAEAAHAQARAGVTPEGVPARPELAHPGQEDLFTPRGETPDQPTAEPMSDLNAQLEDLRNPSHPRQAVYLSPDNVKELRQRGLLDKILEKHPHTLANFAQRGDVVITKGRAATEGMLREKDAGGLNMQEILGRATGSGEGKPEGKYTLLEMDDQRNVTRQSVLGQYQEGRRLAQKWQQEATTAGRGGRTYKVVPTESVVQRRRDVLEAEQEQLAATKKQRPGSTSEQMGRENRLRELAKKEGLSLDDGEVEHLLYRASKLGDEDAANELIVAAANRHREGRPVIEVPPGPVETHKEVTVKGKKGEPDKTELVEKTPEELAASKAKTEQYAAKRTEQEKEAHARLTTASERAERRVEEFRKRARINKIILPDEEIDPQVLRALIKAHPRAFTDALLWQKMHPGETIPEHLLREGMNKAREKQGFIPLPEGKRKLYARLQRGASEARESLEAIRETYPREEVPTKLVRVAAKVAPEKVKGLEELSDTEEGEQAWRELAPHGAVVRERKPVGERLVTPMEEPLSEEQIKALSPEDEMTDRLRTAFIKAAKYISGRFTRLTEESAETRKAREAKEKEEEELIERINRKIEDAVDEVDKPEAPEGDSMTPTEVDELQESLSEDPDTEDVAIVEEGGKLYFGLRQPDESVRLICEYINGTAESLSVGTTFREIVEQSRTPGAMKKVIRRASLGLERREEGGGAGSVDVVTNAKKDAIDPAILGADGMVTQKELEKSEEERAARNEKAVAGRKALKEARQNAIHHLYDIMGLRPGSPPAYRKEYTEVMRERDAYGRPTEAARNMRFARAYLHVLAGWADTLYRAGFKDSDIINPQVPHTLFNSEKMIEALSSMTKLLDKASTLPPREFASFFGTMMRKEVKAGGFRARRKMNKRDRDFLADEANLDTSYANNAKKIEDLLKMAFYADDLWPSNSEYTETIQPIVNKFLDSIHRDGWPSYTPDRVEMANIRAAWKRVISSTETNRTTVRKALQDLYETYGYKLPNRGAKSQEVVRDKELEAPKYSEKRVLKMLKDALQTGTRYTRNLSPIQERLLRQEGLSSRRAS